MPFVDNHPHPVDYHLQDADPAISVDARDAFRMANDKRIRKLYQAGAKGHVVFHVGGATPCANAKGRLNALATDGWRTHFFNYTLAIEAFRTAHNDVPGEDVEFEAVIPISSLGSVSTLMAWLSVLTMASLRARVKRV